MLKLRHHTMRLKSLSEKTERSLFRDDVWCNVTYLFFDKTLTSGREND